jgi:hypothetical protein
VTTDGRNDWQRRYDERQTSNWQRRYDEAIERERLAAEERGDVTGGEVVALEVAGCFGAGGWFGLIGILIVGIGIVVRRRQRRRTGPGA